MTGASASPEQAVLLRLFADGKNESEVMRETGLAANVVRAVRRDIQARAMWPGPLEVARVVLAACKMTGENALQIGEPRKCPRARGVAYLALRRSRPLLHPTAIAAMLGAATPPSHVANWAPGGINLSLQWFSYDLVNSVVEQVYGHVNARIVDVAGACDDAPLDVPKFPVRPPAASAVKPLSQPPKRVDQILRVSDADLRAAPPALIAELSAPARKRAAELAPPTPNLPAIRVSPAAQALADFQNSKLAKAALRPNARIVDHSSDGPEFVDLGDPPPHRSALFERQVEQERARQIQEAADK